MIICQCTGLTDQAWSAAITRARARAPQCILTPGAVLKEAGVVLSCGGCIPELVAQMHRHPDAPPLFAPRRSPKPRLGLALSKPQPTAPAGPSAPVDGAP